ncbi:MAG: DUF2513 domain-containing protein [Muricomes sp.]
MKLNIDCVRDILLVMQDMPRAETLTGAEIREILSEYPADDIDYSCLKLKEAGYIDAIISPYEDNFIVARLDDITFLGHQFLADVYSDNVWNDVKNVSDKIGSHSINALSQIASSVVTAIIKSQLGLT